MSEKKLYIVHCIDTEGPLAEKPFSFEYFKNVKKGARHFDAKEWEKDPGAYIQKHRAHVLGTWDQIFGMLTTATSDEQRNALPDSNGNPWKYSWFCIDHIDFMYNPRKRDMGIHNVFDVYDNIVKEQNYGDGLHWHFHPMSTYKEANICATSYLNSPLLYEILSRRVIERQWFPRANRAGFQDERPDSHWFLEQWIPFDYSNTAIEDIALEGNEDVTGGRFSDWRWAPDDWSTYHPSHDCHQLPGNCRRQIARSLNVLNRFANIDESEMKKAFARADSGKPTIMSVATHDWRDINVSVEYVKYLLKKISEEFPEVRFQYCEAVEAFHKLNQTQNQPPIELNCTLIRDKNNLPNRINVEIKSGEVFGPQPFLAIQTKSQRFIHDNFNYNRSITDWHYCFDRESILPDDVRAIGIAANDKFGNQSIHVIDLDSIKGNQASISFTELNSTII